MMLGTFGGISVASVDENLDEVHCTFAEVTIASTELPCRFNQVISKEYTSISIREEKGGRPDEMRKL